MTGLLCTVLAALTIWDYPSRQALHGQLRGRYVAAVRNGDAMAMEAVCLKGVKLLPEEPTWRYNLACSLACLDDREQEALDALKTAIDLGCRDSKAIAQDTDLKRLEHLPRYRELIEYAERMKALAVTSGPSASVSYVGSFGTPVTLGAKNFKWDFESGCFVADMKLTEATEGGNVGDLYMNRDRLHSTLNAGAYPGITVVSLDQEGRSRNADGILPNMLFPYPVFGNCSQAFVSGPYWRSIPRMLMTQERRNLALMGRLYLSNQTWVYPANADIAPIGTNGDVFASITPFWITTAGRSWSDLPYLGAALDASRMLRPDVKKEIVKRGLLAPTIQTLIRKSLKGVVDEDGYLTARAHPTAMPPNGLDLERLKQSAGELMEAAIPPLTAVVVEPDPIAEKPSLQELTYGSAFAWAFVLRADQAIRSFVIHAKGAEEFRFVQTHGKGVAVRIEQLSASSVRVTIHLRGLSPTNRVDITVVGRNATTGWGAPSYVCFARMDPTAPYSDPALMQPATPKGGKEQHKK